jgi:peptide/nickel transport system permease protein
MHDLRRSPPPSLGERRAPGVDAPPWLRAFWRRKTAVLGLAFVVVVVAMAAAPAAFTPHGPFQQNIMNRLQPPSPEHPLGTDGFGRDLWSRIVHGSRISLLVGVSAVALSALCGVVLGTIAGFFGGPLDRIIMIVVELIIAVPMVLLAIVAIAALGPGPVNLVLAIALAGIPHFARVVRGDVMAIKSLDYVLAARAAGASTVRVLLRHVVANAVGPIIVLATTRVAVAILAEATLSFLGLGISPPTPSWGVLIAEGQPYLITAPWLSLWPGLMIMLVVLAVNLFGDGLRDVADPRTRLA